MGWFSRSLPVCLSHFCIIWFPFSSLKSRIHSVNLFSSSKPLLCNVSVPSYLSLAYICYSLKILLNWFLQQTCIKCLLGTRLCSRHWRYISEQNRQKPLPSWTSLPQIFVGLGYKNLSRSPWPTITPPFCFTLLGTLHQEVCTLPITFAINSQPLNLEEEACTSPVRRGGPQEGQSRSPTIAKLRVLFVELTF